MMVLGGLRRWPHSAGPPTNPPSKTKQNPELLSRADAEEKQELEGVQRGEGNATKPYTCDRPQKYTEHRLQLRTNGRSARSKNNEKSMYTWPLPMHACMHTHARMHRSHIPSVHFTHIVNKKFIILTQVTPPGIHHFAYRCISAAGTTSGPLSFLKPKIFNSLFFSL